MTASLKEAFALFEDDSSDDELNIQNNTTTAQGTTLEHHHPSSSSSSTKLQSNSEKQQTKGESLPPLPSILTQNSVPAIWPDSPPTFLGPIDFTNNLTSIGGARGYVAAVDIPAGTLLIQESPLVKWPEGSGPGPELLVSTVDKILQSKDSDDIQQKMQSLFPQQLEDLPTALRAEGESLYRKPLKGLGSNENLESLLQLVFAMQCNAFGSGVLLHCSILNHSCNPNCVKFTSSEDDGDSSGAAASQVRACRKILKGEEITISYLHPVECLRQSRQAVLKKQFGFSCACELCLSEEEEEASSAAYAEIEQAIPEIERMLLLDNDAPKLQAALAAVLDLFSDALEVMPSHDVKVFIRVHRLVANTCAALLSFQTTEFVEHAQLFLRSTVELLELQYKYLNPDHLDLARTLSDASQGIQILLAHAPEVLYSEFPEWNSFKLASHAENDFRTEHQRVKTLYE